VAETAIRTLLGAAVVIGLLTSPPRLACGAAPRVNTVSSNIEWGKSALLHHHWDQARMYFRNALYLDPKRADAYAYLGDVYRHTGQIDRAREAYREALRLNPHCAEAKHGLRAVLDDREQVAYVAALAEKVRQEPDNADAHATYAEELVDLGQDAAAEAEARKALSLDAKESHARCVLGRLAAKGGRDDEAHSLLEPVATCDDEDDMALGTMGDLAMKGNDFRQATTWYRKAAKAAPEYRGWHEKLRAACAACGDSKGTAWEQWVLNQIGAAPEPGKEANGNEAAASASAHLP
jgi:Tfp pilus assembly protein PilF